MDIFPALFIGRDKSRNNYSEAKSFGFSIVDLSRSDIVQFLSELPYYHNSGVFLTDLSLKPYLAKSILLKFIEDYKGSIVAFSTYDIFDSTFLSRFIYINKIYEFISSQELDPYDFTLSNPYMFKVASSNHPLRYKIESIWMNQ